MEEIAERIKEAILSVVADSGLQGVVVAVSGGVDSAVVLKLSVLSGTDTYALIIPEKGITLKEDTEDAVKLVEELGVKYSLIELNKAFDSVRESFPWDAFDKRNLRISEANIKPRLRMIYSYLVANLDERIVLGTSNRSELLLGYVTKFGDGAADLEPIGALYKTQVYRLAEYLELPKHFIVKKPSAGLWRGQTDEAELGAGYELIDGMLKLLVDEGLTLEQVSAKIDGEKKVIRGIQERVESSRHKRENIKVVLL
ncbi:MAG: NAD(+) synthetase [Candidatus Altiarchaeales archaeon ex4484_2]|nr:MAG: NAD(+) synthetase [Candidatus Altiarchaeales archaeon ex4484_2]